MRRRNHSIGKECDRLFSLLIRARGACERCGTTQHLQCAHIISRRYKAVRWDTANALCLCRGCHYWQTRNPLEGELFFIDHIGEHSYENLRLRALAGGKGMDMNALLVWLQQECKRAGVEIK